MQIFAKNKRFFVFLHPKEVTINAQCSTEQSNIYYPSTVRKFCKLLKNNALRVLIVASGADIALSTGDIWGCKEDRK